MSIHLEKSIELYQSGLPMLEVCKITGIVFSTLQRHLKKRGLSRSTKYTSRKYKVNDFYFHCVDNEQKAYWLGFLFADGFIVKNKLYNQKNVGLSLSEEDLKHLEKFREDVGATYVIKHYTGKGFGVEIKYARLLMTSEQMFDDLQKIGCIERKSLVLKFPVLREDLVRHFIRGYFDGDGSFAKSPDGYKVKICGTKEFLDRLSEYIGFPNRRLSKRYKDTKNNYQLEIGGRLQVLEIGKYLYEGASTYLIRKYDRYKELIY